MPENTASTSNLLILFGQHLASVRRSRGISQERLAAESGLARSYISGVERGKINISLLNIWHIAKTLKVTPAELLNFSSDSGHTD